MSMFFPTTVITPTGPREYMFRDNDETPEAFVDIGTLGPETEPAAGNRTYAEDWGSKLNGPFRDVILERTPDGWVEVEVLAIL